VTSAGDAISLRLVAALHALVLDEQCPSLAAVYPPNDVEVSDDMLWAAITSALVNHAGSVLARLQSPPQTNEVGRAAVLVPGFLTISKFTERPFILSEIGASAGLNMFWDKFGYRLGEMRWGAAASTVQLEPDWFGTASPSATIKVVSRAGCDLYPLNPADHADQLRLLSYIWADQAERIARTRAALAIAAKEQTGVVRADAVQWLERRLGECPEGVVHVVYHTITWQYLSQIAKENCKTMIAAAGARSSKLAPFAWLRFEADGNSPGAALKLTIWPPGDEHYIARADYHGRWINWYGCL
jgi:hypothetical protein